VNLLSVTRKIWHYKLVTLPVILLTLCGAVYVMAISEPVYEASSSYILINPPALPTEEDINRNPALGRINADNPYARFSDQTVVVEVLASSMANQSAQRALLRGGADPRYKVTPGSAFGFSSPMVEITAQGRSPAEAVKSAKVVGKTLIRELNDMQRAEGVDPQYWITAHQVDLPDGAQLKASGQLRKLIGVLALGIVLLFVVVSVADALAILRRERMGRGAPSALAGNEEPWLSYDGRAESLPAQAALSRLESEGGREAGGQLTSLFPDRDAGASVSTNGPRARQRPHR
jgi:capsular polysaccharide biosynthesis protein